MDLPTFDGNSDDQKWLDEFNNAADYNVIDKTRQL